LLTERLHVEEEEEEEEEEEGIRRGRGVEVKEALGRAERVTGFFVTAKQARRFGTAMGVNGPWLGSSA
jgi:hypothetical protein